MPIKQPVTGKQPERLYFHEIEQPLQKFRLTNSPRPTHE